jgi:hypothetical protein
MPRPQSAPNRRRVVAAIPEHTVRPAAAAVAPVRRAAGESHRPTPGLLASRSGSRRSGEPRAARPARRKSDARRLAPPPGPIGGIRTGLVPAPRGWNNCPRLPATNQSGRSERANPGAQSGSDPTRPPVASRARAASTSFPIHTRVPAGASARGCRCEGQRECR